MASTVAVEERDGADPAAFTYDPQVSTKVGWIGFVFDCLRRRRTGRAAISGVTALLFLAGAGMFSYPFFTDLYTDQVIQNRLADEFVGLQVDDVGDWEAGLATGDPLTRMVIPALDVDTVVVSGTSPAALRAGAGHFPTTALPGQKGNVGIAGHRTTYGRPFNRIDELTPGEPIWLQTPVGDFEYVVIDPPTDDCEPYADQHTPDSAACLTDPTAWSMVGETPKALVTLMACHPKGSAAQRIWIRAELGESHEPGTYQRRQDKAEAAAA